ncbi:MAG: bifunctional [glutamate--ammonia ligase]-adenylyl-L-tyrosine phosphorylase/[glutamate--ammonia-ligase] adenylyltransferase [Polyangiaceae bacterium]|nr:bifunctional [glutamate--ammonia ligase]-adenylyl-L-tyrosine phosphorylase/[glutamate--ammonia-ligase] adenylyltransferase [Polyangiaceae bacterium]
MTDRHVLDARALAALAARLDPERARALALRFASTLAGDPEAAAAAVALACAYPATTAVLDTDPGAARLALDALADGGELATRLARTCQGTDDREAFQLALRRGVARERVAVALAELLPAELGGKDIEETSGRLSDLADASIALALAEATSAVCARLGAPTWPDGSPGRLVVLGMGKLGGRELNPGSDVDLVCFYDADEPVARDADGRVTSAHEVWTKIVQRMTGNLADVGAGGFAWRVDHRLRPEGASGPLVNSLAAAERYYESFGRLWERAALLRARPVAGDLALGEELLAMLGPFVWRRAVDPGIATTMTDLVGRARAKLAHPERDLKLGPGGIREAEFFVQTLQLVWGGREPRLRTRGTFAALERLRAGGFVTEREADEVGVAYALLRRAEHAVQHASGLQTHALPTEPEAVLGLARALGLETAGHLEAALGRHRARVGARFASLLPGGAARASRWDEAVAALDRSDRAGFDAALARLSLGGEGSLARDLFELARAPQGPLGAAAREHSRALCDTVLDALADAADPELAARHLRSFFLRLPSIYNKPLAEDPARLRRLVTAFGASAFVGEAVARRPELGDALLFDRALPTAERARAETLATAAEASPTDEDPLEAACGRLRLVKERVTAEVALADLAGDLDDAGAAAVLTALADASLEAATRVALANGGASGPGAAGAPALDGAVPGLCVLGMGKLGGREMGYGSDLDVVFLYDPARASGDAAAYYTRVARRIIALVSMPHAAGRGYELDTRLRPSGSHGMLVVSREAFARYHGVGGDLYGTRSARADTWERMALIRARPCAGDPELGAEAQAIAERAAYEGEAPLTTIATDVHRLRLRMERELGRERPGRYDLKLGRGGLCDVEFAVQLLQLAHGRDPAVRTPSTRVAIRALARAGALAPEDAAALEEGHAFLRRLEQRIRIVHDDASHLIERAAAGLGPLARRMGLRHESAPRAAEQLLGRYREVTERVRAVYERIVVGAAG